MDLALHRGYYVLMGRSNVIRRAKTWVLVRSSDISYFRLSHSKLRLQPLVGTLQDMEVQQRKKYPNWAEEQRKKAAELARVRAIREKKMDRNKKEVGDRAGTGGLCIVFSVRWCLVDVLSSLVQVGIPTLLLSSGFCFTLKPLWLGWTM